MVLVLYSKAVFEHSIGTPGRRHPKTLIISTNVEQNPLEREFSNVIDRLTVDKWQSKTLFLAILDPRSSIVMSVFDCRLPGVIGSEFLIVTELLQSHPSLSY